MPAWASRPHAAARSRRSSATSERSSPASRPSRTSWPSPRARSHPSTRMATPSRGTIPTTRAPARATSSSSAAGPRARRPRYWLARAGHDVVVVERKTFPREKTCGDGLTPRAVHQLEEMGLGDALTKFHRYDGLRACAHGITLELRWPDHPVYPPYGYVVRRRDLDQMVAIDAVAAGRRAARRLRSRRAGARRRPRATARSSTTRRPARPRDPRPLRRDRGRRQLPVRACARYRRATERSPKAWRSAGTTRAPCTPSRGSSPPSTCATATATRCPATAGSSLWATARSTSASGCCRRSAIGSRSTPRT